MGEILMILLTGVALALWWEIKTLQKKLEENDEGN